MIARAFTTFIALGCIAVATVRALPTSRFLSAPGQLPPGLNAMVETERTFARTAAQIGVRDAFLQFFADEATIFAPDAVLAKPEIRKWPAVGPSLQWEPRTGDISSSGDLGYLTGPVYRTAPGVPPQHSCYASVWKLQPDGTFRVVLDWGVVTPERAEFAPGFSPSFHVARYTGPERGAAATASLQKADTDFNQYATSRGLVGAYTAFSSENARIHRNGLVPAVGAASIGQWAATAKVSTLTTQHAEAAKAGDLGYTWGAYAMSQGASGVAEEGRYARVWGRDARGRWQLLLDTSHSVK